MARKRKPERQRGAVELMKRKRGITSGWGNLFSSTVLLTAGGGKTEVGWVLRKCKTKSLSEKEGRFKTNLVWS